MLSYVMGCSLTKPRPNVDSLPIYPHAQVLREERPSPLVRVTYLTTMDEAKVVLDWYQQAMLRDGWEYDPQVSSANRLVFGYNSSWSNEPAYSVGILVDATQSGVTEIRVYWRKELPL
jgi:hypothetical protein